MCYALSLFLICPQVIMRVKSKCQEWKAPEESRPQRPSRNPEMCPLNSKTSTCKLTFYHDSNSQSSKDWLSSILGTTMQYLGAMATCHLGYLKPFLPYKQIFWGGGGLTEQFFSLMQNSPDQKSYQGFCLFNKSQFIYLLPPRTMDRHDPSGRGQSWP